MGNQQARQQRTRERRQDRAERVLSTTKELVLRWGYRKTTLDDIVSHADIGKGTLFLHWRNRDALFISLLRRERVEMLTEMREALTSDPAGVTLNGFVRHYIRAFAGRPLLTALLMGDQTTLGRLAEHKKNSGGASSEMRDEYVTYLATLRERGLVRDDLPVDELVFAFTAPFFGYVAVPLMAPDGFAPDLDRRADLCADNVSRALAPESGAGFDRRDEFREVTLGHLDRILGIAREKYDASLDTDGSGTSAG